MENRKCRCYNFAPGSTTFLRQIWWGVVCSNATEWSVLRSAQLGVRAAGTGNEAVLDALEPIIESVFCGSTGS